MKTKIILREGKTQFPIYPFKHLKITVPTYNTNNSVVTVNFTDILGLIVHSNSFNETGIVFNGFVGDYVKFYFEGNLPSEFEFELT